MAALRRVAGGLTLALALVAGASAQRVPATGDSFERVRGAFAEPHTAAELRRRLGALDPSAIPDMFLLAATGNLPLPDGQSAPLSPDDRNVVREALAARPRREVTQFLDGLAARTPDPLMRLEGQRLLGTIGTGENLKLLARLSTDPLQGNRVRPAVRTGFGEALDRILARDTRALSQVSMLMAEVTPGLSSTIVESVARMRSLDGVRILASALGRAPGLDPLILARLGECGSRLCGRDRGVLESVRGYLRQRDPLVLAAAVEAVGRLSDDEAVESLIGLMEHPDPRVHASVFDALERITGLALERDPVRWSHWYAGEMRWWDSDAPARLAGIERGTGPEFVRSAHEALEHRLFRDRIAESFVLALDRDEVGEVRIACQALGQLRSPVAIEGLIACLKRDDARVREAATAALCAITGRELPPESDSWAEVFG